MAAQLQAPASLTPLLWPATPPRSHHMNYGYRRGPDGEWEPNETGISAAADAQRMVLSYALGYESRGELARRYYVSETNVQYILRGATHRWLTLPVRERLTAHGLAVQKRQRTERDADVRRVLAGLAARAAEMLRFPDLYYSDVRDQLITDIWLLSGAWREDGS